MALGLNPTGTEALRGVSLELPEPFQT